MISYLGESSILMKNADFLVWLCCLGRIPRLSLIQHSLYVGVVERHPPPPLTGQQYGKMEPKYPEGGHCQGVFGVFIFSFYICQN